MSREVGTVESSRTEIPWPHAVTLVLATTSARQRRWAVATAIDIVRKLASQRPKVVLADIQLRQPSSLAATLGVEEGEGIVDVLFRGASFSAVAHEPESESFFFLTLGGEPPPRQIFLRHPRWEKIASRLAQTDAHLLPCVASDDLLEAGPIPGFESCIVLNATGQEIELPEGARRLAEFLAPPEVREEGRGRGDLPSFAASDATTRPMPGGPPRTSREDEAPEDRTAAQPSEPEPVEAAPAPGLAPPEDRWASPERSFPAPPPSLVTRRRRRSLVPAVAITLAAIAAVVLWRTIGVAPEPEEPAPVQAAAETTDVNEPTTGPVAAPNEAAPPASTAEPTAGSRRSEVSLPYSVVIASYSSFDDALTRREDWASREDVPFYVAPTVVRGVVYYRVFAGLLPDRDRAEELMDRLVSEGIKETGRAWDVRPARLAFDFGIFPNAEEAQQVVDTLLGQGIHAYLVPAAGAAANGSAYHVYAGGYEKPEDAAPLRERLESLGHDVELVERVGLELP